MPDVQEVFRLATREVRPDPGFLDRQLDHRRTRERRRRVGAFAVVAGIAAVATVLLVRASPDGHRIEATRWGTGSVDPIEHPSHTSRTVEGVRFSFTVTAGGWQAGPVARRSDGSGFRGGRLYLSKSAVGPQGAEAVLFWTSFPGGEEAVACAGVLSPTVGASVADLAAAVATAPGTELASGPSDVSVGGRAAKRVVLIVREDVGCDPGFFYTWHDEKWGAFWPGTAVGDTITVWILDVDGTRLFIEAETTMDSRPELKREIEEIIGSIRFD